MCESVFLDYLPENPTVRHMIIIVEVMETNWTENPLNRGVIQDRINPHRVDQSTVYIEDYCIHSKRIISLTG